MKTFLNAASAEIQALERPSHPISTGSEWTFELIQR